MLDIEWPEQTKAVKTTSTHSPADDTKKENMSAMRHWSGGTSLLFFIIQRILFRIKNSEGVFEALRLSGQSLKASEMPEGF